jgi:hypothetical protein
MMGELTIVQEALFYEFSLERHLPPDHLLRSIDRFVDLSNVRAHLRPFAPSMRIATSTRLRLMRPPVSLCGGGFRCGSAEALMKALLVSTSLLLLAGSAVAEEGRHTNHHARGREMG